MAAAFGVHFGCTSACLAVSKDGKANVVANEFGDRVTPAIVAFTDHDLSVGLAAKQGLIRNATNTVCNVKQLLGLSWDNPEVQAVQENNPVKITEQQGEPVYEVEYKEKTAQFSPEQVATYIFKNILEVAERHGQGPGTHDAVLSVPVAFSEERRKVLKASAEKAGFSVLRLISPPVAASLAYNLGQLDQTENSIVLVYRLGGVSLDISIISVNSGMYHVLTTIPTQAIGGHDVTRVLIDHFASDFQRQLKMDCRENKRSLAKLRNAAETCKHVLSNMPSAQCSVDSLYEGVDFQCSISRPRFEGLVSSVIQKCLAPVDTALSQAHLTRTDIQKVILAGGSTKIPILQKYLQDYFPGAELLMSVMPDEAIAVGAAIQASILANVDPEERDQNSQQTLLPSVPTDILIEAASEDGPEHIPVIVKDTPLPFRRQRRFTLPADQTSFCLHLLLPPNCDSQSPQSLAKVVMNEIPGGSTVSVVFHGRSDGSLHVTCTEPDSEQTQDVLISTS